MIAFAFCGSFCTHKNAVEQLQELVFSHNPSAKGSFPGGVVITREYGRLVKLEDGKELAPAELTCPGQLKLPEIGLRVICRSADVPVNSPNAFTVWPNGKMVLRSRQVGDTLTTAGGTKSLKERFIDRKIPAAKRCLVPVVADEQGILGVYGFGADVSRVKTDTKGITIIFEEIESAKGV